MSIFTPGLMVLENLINQTLKLDPLSMEQLGKLSDKVIEINTGLLHYYLLPHEQGVNLLATYEGPVDASISGAPFSLLRLLQTRDNSLLSSGDIKIEGDNQVVQKLLHIAGGMQIDWEEKLSQYVGDGPAHWMGRGIRKTQEWQRNSLHELQLNIAEYLQEELKVLPAEGEMQAFIEDVDQLRNDVDRFEQRLLRLQAQRTPAAV